MGFMGVRNNNTFIREARAVESLVLFISDRVREGAEFLCNVNFHNSALFVLVGGGVVQLTLALCGSFMYREFFGILLTILVYPFYL